MIDISVPPKPKKRKRQKKRLKHKMYEAGKAADL